jgi:predicted site-specific integrase-resolvase
MHEPVSTDNEYLMTSDVARELEIAKETVLQLNRNGKLHAIRAANGFRLFRRADVEKLKQERGAVAR